MIQDAIGQAVERKNLSEAVAHQVMREMMRGDATPSQIGSFLTAMRMKGETEEELRGFVIAMREGAHKIKSPHGAVDLCGTGGDGAKTFNISTVSSIVVASAGAAVAKHGNRSVSSKCGSADVLGALGIPYDLPPDMVQTCLDSCGLGFMFAPVFHESMKNVMASRREVGLRTFFNILGPMANPAGVKNQLIGVFDASVAAMMARVLRDLGTERALIVNGSGTDECTTSGITHVVDLRGGAITEYDIEPSMFGLDHAEPGTIRGGDAAENARIALRILRGERSPRADVVALNAAAGLYASGRAETIDEGLEMARHAMASGLALRKGMQFARISWELEARRQREMPVGSLTDRRLHPETLKLRAADLCKHLLVEASNTDLGREMLECLDQEILANPSVLSVIALKRIISVANKIDAVPSSATRSRTRLSDEVSSANGIAVIAEYKARSPTTGPLAVPLDPAAVASSYNSSGVAGVSVVVEPDLFSGSLEAFATIRSKLSLPVLFKDFIMSEAQLEIAERLGADAVLLIAKMLRGDVIDSFVEGCLSRGMEPLVEIHDLADLKKFGATANFDRVRMMGVNSRDLRTLETDLANMSGLRNAVAGDKLVVAESGIRTPSDVRKITEFDAVLVGSALMQAEDLDTRIRELVALCGSVAR